MPDFPRMFGGKRKTKRKAKSRPSSQLTKIQRIPTRQVSIKDLPICLRRYYEHIGKPHIWAEPYAYPKSPITYMPSRVYVLLISDVPVCTFTCVREATLTCKALQAFLEGSAVSVCCNEIT